MATHFRGQLIALRHSDLGELRDLAHRADGPKYLEDFLYSDEPQLFLHAVYFQDATLVSVSWPHNFLDATAMASLLSPWALVMNGQELPGWPPSFGDGGSRVVIFSNWTKAAFFKLDFGSAATRGIRHLTPSFVNLSGYST